MRLPFLILCGLLFSRSLAGQRPAVRDSAARDTTHIADNEGGLLLALAAFMVAAAAAPALLAMSPNQDTTVSLPSRSLRAYVAAGGTGASSLSSFTLVERADLMSRHAYGSLESEYFDQERLHFYSARAGYLLRPHGASAGGLTLGYRYATGNGAEDAILIGLPLVFGSERATMWLEPTYAISHHGVSWGYRFEGDVYLLPRPFFLGLRIDALPLRHGADYVGTLALLFGIHQ